MSDKKQLETEQPRQQNKVWPWVKGIIWIIMIALGGLSLFICWFYLSPERRAANDHTALIVYLIGLAAIGVVVLCIPQIITSNPKKYFITRVLVTGITGGVLALLLPVAVKSTTTGVGGLRHSILLATGGLIAIFTLGETRRKNDIDKKKNKQEKKKNDKDHRRQIRAERRERYTKAVEQLGSKESSVRMGGVYTLVGLVDEWLEEESISEEERLKEGQVIINNLCAYIRSPFTLASHYDELSQDTPKTEMVYKDNQQKSYKKWQIISNNLYTCIRSRFNSASRYDELSQDNPTAFYKDKEQEFYADKATLKSEADVRRSIIKEIHDRLQGPEENTPGKWSDFEYDFSGSKFFYPVDLINSYYKKSANFCGSHYYKEVNFSGSHYHKEVNFSGSTYEKDATFSTSDFPSTYKGEADFRGSIYTGEANFSRSTYGKDVTFSTSSTSDFRSTYVGKVNFSDSTYGGAADFSSSTYGKDVTFSTSDFSSTYKGEANFSRSTYEGEADFSFSTYEGEAGFRISTYEGGANFIGSIYLGQADFSESTYAHKGKASFSSSIYLGQADFRGSTYEKQASFSHSIYKKDVIFGTFGFRSTYMGKADFLDSIYLGQAKFNWSIYQDVTDFSGSIYYKENFFGGNEDNGFCTKFTRYAPQFYGETNNRNTLFGSHDNNFTVDAKEGYSINLNSEGLPLGCDLLNSKQKNDLQDIFHEMEKVNNELLEVKDPKDKARLSKKLRSLTEELHEWREEATTVKAEDVAAEDTES